MTWIVRDDVEYDAHAGEAVVRFEQAPDHDGVDDRPGFPPREHVRSTRWFDDYKRVVVACRMCVRQVEDLWVAPDHDGFVDDLWYRSEHRALVLEGIEIKVRAIDLTLVATDEVVGHQRLRLWRILGAESVFPWKE